MKVLGSFRGGLIYIDDNDKNYYISANGSRSKITKEVAEGLLEANNELYMDNEWVSSKKSKK